MLTLRSLAIAMAGAGVLAGLPVTEARACDNDRYPCPVVAQPQEAADPAVRPPSRKKASQAARHDERRAQMRTGAQKPNDKHRKDDPRRMRLRRLRRSKRPMPARAKREVLSPRSPRRSGATKAQWQPRQPLGSFFPIPPAPARRAQRLNRMRRLNRVQRVMMPH